MTTGGPPPNPREKRKGGPESFLQPKNALEALLIQEIQKKGPISLARYMEHCLLHPRYGFYMKAMPLGKTGAFTTAPEISQLFGEILGLWLVAQWENHGKPSSWNLLELGPGRGTLIKDILRMTRPLEAFQKGLTLQMVEVSPPLKRYQQESIKFPKVFWHTSVQEALDACGDTVTFILANEFFDALPVHSYVFRDRDRDRDRGWYERCVDYTVETGFLFREILLKSPPVSSFVSPLVSSPVCSFPKVPFPQGGIYEHSPLSLSLFQDLCTHLKKVTGAFLIIDYGYPQAQGRETFQALYQHGFGDPFSHVGDSDLTCHVNFGALIEIALGLGMDPLYFGSQREFLSRWGIQKRLEVFKTHATAHATQIMDLEKGVERLLGPMGTLFKVLALSHEDSRPYKPSDVSDVSDVSKVFKVSNPKRLQA